MDHDFPRRRSFIVEILKFSILALLVVTPFRMFVAQPFFVSGASMEPTFDAKEYLVVDELSYRFEKPERGDVVIFRYPLDPAIYYIKRIVGLPGETIEVKSGKVLVKNGEEGPYVLTEPYAVGTNKRKDGKPLTLEEGEYFVMGDNRDDSADSRSWGPIHERHIIGRAFMRLFPFQEAAILPGDHQF